MTTNVLLEIGTEEIPAGYIPPALSQIEELSKNLFQENRITVGEIKSFGTPRRLVLYAKDVIEKQPDLMEKVQGPPKKAAFKPDGTPTPAATGFAKSKGVTVDDLFIETTERGDYVFANVETNGKATREILPEILTDIISALSFPKTMRWDDSGIVFARPIRWLLALSDDAVIPFEYGNLTSSNFTFGHYFTHPDAKIVENADDYFSILDTSNVMLDQHLRKKDILNQLNQEAEKNGGTLLFDEELLDAVNYLVEFPVVVSGSFPEKFLELPDRVLIRAMAEHQKYFSVTDDEGHLLPMFLNVLGNAPKDTSQIIKGNEQVLLARLDDAKFFYEEDTKTRLMDKVESLKHVIFQEDLGSVYEKTERVKNLAYFIAEQLNLSQKESLDAQRAALLCKADLVTNMINEKEFAKLQGYMGMEYAKASGESEDVAMAIYEHYLPRFADDDLPETNIGAVVSIADKIDSIVGCFGVGLIPTGSQDPYALRRQAIGITRIILNKNFNFSLSDLVYRSAELLYNRIDEENVEDKVLEFIRDRISNLFMERGFKYDTVDAVLSTTFDILPDAQHRLEAVSQFRNDEQFEALAIGFKRVVNILSKSDTISEPHEELLQEDAEKKLYNELKETEETVRELLFDREYIPMMERLVKLRPTIDNFFDNVMVNVEDDELRNNRLTILHKIRSIFFQIADFSKIVVEG